MAKLFNTIRKKIITEKTSVSRTTNYIKYAIGEIILVVIGILIALSINNWNEQQKLNKEEQYLLKELLAEFNTNLIKIKSDIHLNTKNQKAAIAILDLIASGDIKNNPQKLDSLFMVVFSYGSFNASSGVLDEIISSGKLRVIKAGSLRNMLSRWSGWIENQQEDINIRRDQINFYIEPLYVKYAPIKNGDAYIDFKFWSLNYNRTKLKKSNFNYNYKGLMSTEFEGSIYKYVLDQDFVLLNDTETEIFINNIIKEIKTNITPQ